MGELLPPRCVQGGVLPARLPRLASDRDLDTPQARTHLLARGPAPILRSGLAIRPQGGSRLPRLIGHSRAMDLVLTGRAVTAAEVARISLVNRLVPAGQALVAAQQLASELAALPPEPACATTELPRSTSTASTTPTPWRPSSATAKSAWQPTHWPGHAASPTVPAATVLPQRRPSKDRQPDGLASARRSSRSGVSSPEKPRVDSARVRDSCGFWVEAEDQKRPRWARGDGSCRADGCFRGWLWHPASGTGVGADPGAGRCPPLRPGCSRCSRAWCWYRRSVPRSWGCHG